MKALAPLLLLPLIVFADTGVRTGNDGAFLPVRDLECQADGGLTCFRDAGTSTGVLRCSSATATEPGCITPSAQSFAGAKTWNARQRIVGVAHGSLTACSSGEKGTWQTCTTDNAPVFCNGTTNIELTGPSSRVTLASLPVNRMFHALNGYPGAFTLPYDYTITTASGIIGTGAGTTINLRFSDGTNNCDCSINCVTGAISACTGNCTYAASTQVVAAPNSDGCTTPITIWGDLTVAGYRL